MSALNWLRLLLLSLLWGGTFLFAAVAIKGWPAGAGGIPPLTVVFARVAVAAATLLLALRLMGVAVPSGRRVWAAFLGMGLLNNAIPFSLIFWGQSHLPASVAAGLASILNATTPLFTVVVAHALTADEKATRAKVAAVLIGLLGVAAMIGADAVGRLGVSVAGQLACLGAALTYAFASLYGRRFKAMGVTPVQTAFGQVAASSAVMLPLALIVDQPWTLPAPGIAPVAAVIAMGVVSTALAYILFFQILASAGATNLMLVTFLIPVSGVLLGWAVLGEALKLQHLLGMACIGLSLALVDGRLFRRGRSGIP
jgi:drug/metabolite transporter (DMT)-like permease